MVGATVVAEWPKGQRQVSRPLGPAQLKVEVQDTSTSATALVLASALNSVALQQTAGT